MENEDKAIEILKGKKFFTIGNFSYNDAFDAIIEMAEWKDAQRRTPSDDTTEGFVHIVIGEVACHETELNRQIEQGKSFAEHNKVVYDVALAVAASYSENAESQRQSIKRLNDENDKLRFSLSEREKEIERLKDEHQKEMDEYRAVYFRQNTILVEQNNALKRQLDESNKQILIYAKKVRNLEAELEEDGSLG